MSTPITIKRQVLRAGGAMPKSTGTGCSIIAPTEYVIQSFGIEVSEVDVYDALVALYDSAVMQGLQNFEDTPEFRASSYTKVSYTGTNYRNTDGVQIFKGSEEHTAKWVEEDDPVDGLIWLT